MQKIIKILDKFIEVSLFLILLILLCSYQQVSIKHSIIFIFVTVFISYVILQEKTTIINANYWAIFLALLVMFIFDFCEKVDFIEKFGIPIEMSIRIPVSTILLSVAFLAYLIKTQIEGKLVLSNPFSKYFLISCLFLCLLSCIFYPILKVNYQLGIETTLILSNKILKYLIIMLLTTSYLNSEDKIKRLSIGLVLILSILTITNLLVSIF